MATKKKHMNPFAEKDTTSKKDSKTPGKKHAAKKTAKKHKMED
jgi:hypothetical protein